MNTFICYVALSLSLFPVVLTTENEPWDYFLFVQQWPQSLCIKEEAGGKNCTVPKTINYWTIHGLWPSNAGVHTPSHCEDVKFDKNQIKNLIPQMDLYWVDLLSKKTLWQHEWYIHGTCALSLNATNSESLYFGKGLALRKTYDFNSMLSKCHITPSSKKKYKASAIHRCLKKQLGVDPDLHCYKDTRGKLYLSEIRLCITKSFVLENCHKYQAVQHSDKKSPALHPCGSLSVYYPIIKYL